jgi:hypothetical protein
MSIKHYHDWMLSATTCFLKWWFRNSMKTREIDQPGSGTVSAEHLLSISIPSYPWKYIICRKSVTFSTATGNNGYYVLGILTFAADSLMWFMFYH